MKIRPVLALTLLALALGCGKKNLAPADQLKAGVNSEAPADTGNAPHERMATPAAKPTPRKTSMAEVAKRLDFGGNSFTYHSSKGTQSGLEILLSLFETVAQEEGDPQVTAIFKVIRELYNESGLKDISGTGSSSFVLESGITRNAMMAHHWPGQDKGLLWKLLGGPAHELDGLKLMPAHAALAVHGDLDVAAGWKWLKGFLAKQNPALARELNAQLEAMANENIPVDELIDSLGGAAGLSVVLHPSKTVKIPVGGKWVVDGNGNERFVPSTITVPEPGLVLAVNVKDTLLPELVAGLLQAQGAKPAQVNGVTLWTLASPPGQAPIPLSPTVMKSGDYLVFASTEALAKEVLAIQSGQAKGLAGTADFQKVAAGLELKGNHLLYLSPLVQTTATKLLQDALAGEEGIPNPQAREMMMKLFGMFADYLSHQIVLVQRLPDGLLVDNRATRGGMMAGGGGGTGTVATVGVMASMLLPALAKAKQKANVVKSANNARQLSRALMVFADDNDNKLPPGNRWCDAILRDVGTERVFASPQDPTSVARQEAGQKFSSYALNAAVAGKDLFDLPPDTVLVFECPLGWNRVGGLADIQRATAQPGLYQQLQTIAVTFVDGSTRQTRFAELRQLNWAGQRRQ